ncbi:NLR family CARD domain-containing protein 3-like [Dermacentor albipictus]|uniref:NLR family CARD domain-containing protein 3-like n=1 Tax=Dermacentor albipictus TaxID=60249 RepID=UPI0031FDF78E
MSEPVRPPSEVQSRTTNVASLEFSQLLHKTDASVFESAECVLQIFQLADQRFRGNDSLPPLTAPCNGDGERTRCWALNYLRRWNQLLNDGGVELLELSENALSCSTISNVPEELRTSEDIQILTLCLWLLRQHQCVRAVTLTACVVRPQHSAIFWKLLQLSKRAMSVELRNSEHNVESLSIRSLFRDGAEQLSELVLADFSLSESDASDLLALLERNRSLGKLVLINLNVDEQSLHSIVASIKDHDQLNEVELTERRKSIASNTVSQLLEARITKLHLNVDCNWEAALHALATKVTPAELKITSRSTFHSALSPLARAVATSETLKCLELILDASCAVANENCPDWEDLADIIAQCRALRTLRIDVPSLVDVSPAAMSDAIARNWSLQELHFSGCAIPCHSALVLFDGLSRNSTLQLLGIVNIEGVDAEYEHLLRFLIKNSLCHRVSVRYEGCQAKLLVKAITIDGMRFRNFKFFCTYAPEANAVYEALPFLKDTLTTLSIDSNEEICDMGAESLAKLFSDSLILENVELKFPSTPDTSLVLLQGLAQSRSITSLTLVRWAIGGDDDAVPLAFEDLLRVNSSIVELHLVQGDSGDLDILRKHLAIGLVENHSVAELHILYGRDVLVYQDKAIMQSLRVNRTMALLAAKLLLGARLSRGAVYSLERVLSCDSMMSILRSRMKSSSDVVNEKLAEVLSRIQSELFKVECLNKQRACPSPRRDHKSQHYELRNVLLSEIGKYLNLSDVPLRL